MRIICLLAAVAMAARAANSTPAVLVVTADAGDYLLAAGGTIAKMIDGGAIAYLIRATNDEKDSWGLSPEETALRTGSESSAAAKILGIKDVISLGYLAAELADVPFTTLRDRILFQIRHYRPRILFLPNPYTDFDRVLDRYYTGRAAEDAWRAAALENFQLPFTEVGLKTHLVPEVYYYAQPYDPYRREAESTAMFVPQPKMIDIASTLERKIRAAQALRTINGSMARRLKERLKRTDRRLPILDNLDDKAVDQLVEQNVRGLARIAAQGTTFRAAEEFRYAGVEFRIPARYLQ